MVFLFVIAISSNVFADQYVDYGKKFNRGEPVVYVECLGNIIYIVGVEYKINGGSIYIEGVTPLLSHGGRPYSARCFIKENPHMADICK